MSVGNTEPVMWDPTSSINSPINAFGFYGLPPEGAYHPQDGQVIFMKLSNVSNALSLPIIGTIIGLFRIIMNSIAINRVHKGIDYLNNEIKEIENTDIPERDLRLGVFLDKDSYLENLKSTLEANENFRRVLITEIARGALEFSTLGFAGIVLLPIDGIVSLARYINNVCYK